MCGIQAPCFVVPGLLRSCAPRNDGIFKLTAVLIIPSRGISVAFVDSLHLSFLLLSIMEYGVGVRNKPTGILVVAGLLVMPVMGYAGGFSLYTEGAASEIGNFAAGAAAEAGDAAIGWYNPAGLVLLSHQELLVSGVGVLASDLLTGSSTYAVTPASPLLLEPYTQTFADLQGGKNGFVPAIHYALPLNSTFTAGLSLVAPFGLSTEYGESSPVRYAATLTSLETLDLSPELGARFNENFAIGAGLDFQWARVKFNQILGEPQLTQAFPELSTTTLDSLSYNQGRSFGFGFHVGVMGLFHDGHTRLGVNYQSSIHHIFYGHSRLTGPLADPDLSLATLTQLNPNSIAWSNNLSSDPVGLPDLLTLSIYQDVTDKVALLGSIVYTGWHDFREITLNNAIVPNLEDDTLPPQILISQSIPQGYRNTLRASVGANYKVNAQLMLKAGGGYDQTPTVSKYRDIRLPDNNRWAAALGAHYQASPSWTVDVGYAYLWAPEDADVNNTTTLTSTSYYNVNAKAALHAHLIGAQVVWIID